MHIDELAITEHRDYGAVAGAMALDERQEGVGGYRLLAIDGDDCVGVAAVDLSLFVGERSTALLLADDAKRAEAGSLGRPVVATDVGGNREVVVDGETGLLVAPGDLGGVAGALLRLARDPELRRAMGERALARHEDLFTLERMVDGYRSLLEGELRATP